MATILRGDDNFDTENVLVGVAKAWVNFDGTGVVAIRSAFNVDSVTDNGVGNYTANFTNAMPDVNYSVSGSGGAIGVNAIRAVSLDTAFATTSLSFQIVNSANTPTDPDYATIQTHGN